MRIGGFHTYIFSLCPPPVAGLGSFEGQREVWKRLPEDFLKLFLVSRIPESLEVQGPEVLGRVEAGS